MLLPRVDTPSGTPRSRCCGPRSAAGSIEALERFGAERGVDLLTVAVSGLAAQPMVASVISGVSRPEQIAKNIAAASWEPTSADLDALDEIQGLHTGSYTSFATDDPNPYWLSRRLR